jgi:hypothetical protein
MESFTKISVEISSLVLVELQQRALDFTCKLKWVGGHLSGRFCYRSDFGYSGYLGSPKTAPQQYRESSVMTASSDQTGIARQLSTELSFAHARTRGDTPCTSSSGYESLPVSPFTRGVLQPLFS